MDSLLKYHALDVQEAAMKIPSGPSGIRIRILIQHPIQRPANISFCHDVLNPLCSSSACLDVFQHLRGGREMESRVLKEELLGDTAEAFVDKHDS